MWAVVTTEDFDDWFEALAEAEREEVAAKIGLLKLMGPQLKRPHADTLNGSAYKNMKELRAKTRTAVIRIAFAFDPHQEAILLVGGDKSGVSEKRFYSRLIEKADRLYKAHLDRLERQEKKGKGT